MCACIVESQLRRWFTLERHTKKLQAASLKGSRHYYMERRDLGGENQYARWGQVHHRTTE